MVWQICVTCKCNWFKLTKCVLVKLSVPEGIILCQSINSLAPQQAIAWANVDSDLCRDVVSLGCNELTDYDGMMPFGIVELGYQLFT